MFFSRLFVTTLAFTLLTTQATAVEPWASKELRVTDGLQLWIDASQQDAARQATNKPPLNAGAARAEKSVDEVLDASGHGWHLQQPDEAARPSIVRIADRDVLRFDGEADHLRRTGLKNQLDAFSIFFVAAPQSNPGLFRGFLAINAPEQRDYESGMTVDLGPTFTARLEQINIEGRGFGGAEDLMQHAFDFGGMHLFETHGHPDAHVVNLFIDGQWSGHRPWEASTLAMDEVTVGARFYTNGPGPQQARGPFAGYIGELLIYNRVLTRQEAAQVREYLSGKWKATQKVLHKTTAPSNLPPVLQTVLDPPTIQPLVRGFNSVELPLDLPNINNVRYRADGTVVALAYNGDIYLLKDEAKKDGLEDTAHLFFEGQGRLRGPIGMALTPPNYPRGQGVFVASKGKCSLIVDTNGDDRADDEIVIAEGWQELPHGVDSLGVAVDPQDASVYFGIGTTDYTNAYLVDAKGQAGYRLDSEHGTIMRIGPDLKSRGIVCTGIRFPVGLAFNNEHDLFCTDQEGATWLSNGNPFDELLHVQPGRHYGFPPRHPTYLPNVIDEPSTFDFRPQHQSTCGLLFNTPNTNGVQFGPAAWANDAFVCGYSRGKIYRTKLCKTPQGYLADSNLFACLNLLTVDACVSPQGDLLIATHSGGPDWGSGPQGKGKLYKIAYQDRSLPQPVCTWAADANTVCVAFDQPLSVNDFKDVAKRVGIAYGPFVQAGDRFETVRPGYEAVSRQQAAGRNVLEVRAVQLSPDRRTLIVSTDTHLSDSHYAFALEMPAKAVNKSEGDTSTRPLDLIELAYELRGVMLEITKTDGTHWEGWSPHLDFDVAKAFTRGSQSHEEAWALLTPRATVHMRTTVDVRDMLRPAVQPGSTIDYVLPPEQVTLVLESTIPLKVHGALAKPDGKKVERTFRVEVPVPDDAKGWMNLEVECELNHPNPALHVSYYTNEDSTQRPLLPHRLRLPWAPHGVEKNLAEASAELPTIAERLGGNWGRGRRIFFGQQAQCSKCHRAQESGGEIGPNLANLWQRDEQSVRRDMHQPNFAINPDYVSYTAVLTDGRVLNGTLRKDADKMILADTEARETVLATDEIEQLLPSALSIMPEGLLKQLSDHDTQDLLTYLLSPPPRMPQYAPGERPPPRTLSEVEAVLAGSSAAPADRKLRILLVTGAKDHGVGEHDYPAWGVSWERLLGAAENVEISRADGWPSREALDQADVMVLYQHGDFTPERAKDWDAFLAKGKGGVLIHFAVDGGQDPPGFAQRIGLAWQGGASKFRHGPLDLHFAKSNHPISRNLERVQLVDESYWQLVGDSKRIELLASGEEEGAQQPLFWTYEPPKGGRVFVSIPGHFSWTFDDPIYRIILLRGIAWSANESVDRFNDLVLFGANWTK